MKFVNDFEKNRMDQKLHPTGTPEKRLTPPYEDPKITDLKYKSIRKLIEGEFDDIEKNRRQTVLDFHGLSPDLKEDDILKWINKEIGISPENILADGSTEESAKVYRSLDFSYKKGKDFLKNTLKYSDSELSIGPTSISSKKDLFDLLNKTVFMAGNKGLSKALLYCRIVKATIVASETLKYDATLLKQVTVDFEESLVAPISDKGGITTPLVSLNNEEEKIKRFYSAKDGRITGQITSRGKDLEKVMLRFITRVEADAKTALKDGIASRITIEEKKSLKLLPILCEWLTKDMGVVYLEIENQSFFPEDKLNEIRNLITKFLPENKFSLKNDKADSTSMGNFQAFKITGVLNFSNEKEDQSNTIHKHARQFEIQLVKPFNKNEEGKMDHSVFDVVKFVVARTRLDGGCPENVFDQFVKDASLKSGMSERKIVHYLTELKDSPILKMKKKNNKKGESIYIAHSVYSRWNSFSWVDSGLISDINFAKNKNKE